MEISETDVEKMTDSRDTEGLVRALKQYGRPGIHLKVAKALDTLGWRPANSEDKVYHLLALREYDKLKGLGEDAVEPLIRILEDENQPFIATTLGLIGDPRAVKPIIRAWRADRDSWWQFDMKNALFLISDPAALDPLVEALQGKGVSPGRRWLAAMALGWLKDARAMEPLIQALKDEDTDLREHAAEALGEIGDTGAVEALIEALWDERERVRETAIEALKNIGDERAVLALEQAVRDRKIFAEPAEEAIDEIRAKRERRRREE
jgi:HEAT repeat protein